MEIVGEVGRNAPLADFHQFATNCSDITDLDKRKSDTQCDIDIKADLSLGVARSKEAKSKRRPRRDVNNVSASSSMSDDDKTIWQRATDAGLSAALVNLSSRMEMQGVPLVVQYDTLVQCGGLVNQTKHHIFSLMTR